MDRLLPRCVVGPEEVADVGRLFSPAVTGLRLEIGSGGGEHVHAQARHHPEIGFIACEPFRNGVASLMQHLDGAWCPNLRVFPGDGREIVDHLPDAVLSRVDLLYPDPWPKRRQRKRRFVSTGLLCRLARVMAPDAVFRFATDIDDYAGWALARVLASPDFTWVAGTADNWLTPWPDWVQTRYEVKAIRQGRRPVYLTFRRH